MEEMELKLTTPIDRLIPTSIDWNKTELEGLVDDAIVKYQNVVVTRDTLQQARDERAKLNKFIEMLNKGRISAGKEYMAPYEKFKGDVDGIIAKVRSVNNVIDDQIKSVEAAVREEKYAEISAYFSETIGDLACFVPLDRIFDQKWLNASVSIKNVKKEIDGIIEKIRSHIATIEALHSPDEVTVKAFFFETLDIAAALMEDARLKEKRARVEAYQKAQAEVAAAQNPTDNQKPQEDGLQASLEASECNSSTPIYSAPGMTVRFEVTGTVEELKGLKEYLQTHHIVYKAI